MVSNNVFRILSRVHSINPTAKLVAATKYANADAVNDLLESGVRAIGENRVLDAEEKFTQLEHPCEKHFIGTIQSNKIRKIADLFDVVQSLCRQDHAVKLNSVALEKNKKIRVLVQINAGLENQKQGLKLDEKAVSDFLVSLRPLSHLQVVGLMVVVPEGKGPLFFPSAKHLFDALASDFDLTELSMGSSDDYEKALACGATMVRVGRILFDI